MHRSGLIKNFVFTACSLVAQQTYAQNTPVPKPDTIDRIFSTPTNHYKLIRPNVRRDTLTLYYERPTPNDTLQTDHGSLSIVKSSGGYNVSHVVAGTLTEHHGQIQSVTEFRRMQYNGTNYGQQRHYKADGQYTTNPAIQTHSDAFKEIVRCLFYSNDMTKPASPKRAFGRFGKRATGF